MSPKKISILVPEPLADEGLAILKSYPDFAVDVCLNLKESDLVQKIGEYDALLVRSQTSVNSALIKAGKKLKLIGRAGVGLDNIDTKTAAENKITVINTPFGNSVSTAELAFGLMLSLARKIPFAFLHMREHQWQRNQFMGSELYRKTLGIIGFGNVGRELATRAKAFSMRVIAFDPLINKSTFNELNTESVSIDELLATADFISLHCGLNDKTKNIINEKTIAVMKKGCFLINTARGELIDNDALIKGLETGRLARAALDVYKKEPPAADDPVINHPQIVTTPHLGASTVEAQIRVSTMLAEYTIDFFRGKTGAAF
jgi:D-3-phosphoglycerate dehydrogenase / 2-oxoglutarate reductase